MSVRTGIEGNVATVWLEGRVTHMLHPEIREAAYPLLDSPEVGELRLELAGVSYMDSSSLGILLLLHERAAAKGKRIVLARPTASMRCELHVVQFERIFHIEE